MAVGSANFDGLYGGGFTQSTAQVHSNAVALRYGSDAPYRALAADVAIGDEEITGRHQGQSPCRRHPISIPRGPPDDYRGLGKAILPAEEKMVALITAGFGNSASGEQPKAKPPKVSIRMPSQFGNLRPSQARMNLAKRKSRFTQPQVTANVVDINPESELAKQENPFLPLEWE